MCGQDVLSHFKLSIIVIACIFVNLIYTFQLTSWFVFSSLEHLASKAAKAVSPAIVAKVQSAKIVICSLANVSVSREWWVVTVTNAKTDIGIMELLDARVSSFTIFGLWT